MQTVQACVLYRSLDMGGETLPTFLGVSHWIVIFGLFVVAGVMVAFLDRLEELMK